jgi:hypothetical protein
VQPTFYNLARNYLPALTTIKKGLVIMALVCISLVAIATTCIYFGRGPKKEAKYQLTRKVSIQQVNGKYSFYKEGKPVKVKGAAGYTQIRELASYGGNTIMCWDTSKLENTLVEAARYKVWVIIGLDIPSPKYEDFYRDEVKLAALYHAYSNLVLKYKDHPALLAWCLGNEIEFPFTLTNSPFYKSYNKLLSRINFIDRNHPVTTTLPNIAKRSIVNIQWKIPGLDFISFNTYNQLKTIRQDLTAIKWIWDGPYLVSEWAPNGGWEAETTAWHAPIENTSTKKAEQYSEFYKDFMPHDDERFLGSLAFYWGSRQEYTSTWYGVYNDEGAATEVAEVLNDCWKDTVTEHRAPRVRFMLVDDLGAKDNIILSAGSNHQAAVFLENENTRDSLQYSWQIVKEDWLSWGRTWNHFKKPAIEAGLITGSCQDHISFKLRPPMAV